MTPEQQARAIAILTRFEQSGAAGEATDIADDAYQLLHELGERGYEEPIGDDADISHAKALTEAQMRDEDR